MIKYEEKSSLIDDLIKRRRHKWQLDAITWMDFEDVKQLIKIHIHLKWHQWDQTRPLEPWVNQIIHNRMINLGRDNYSSFARPCLKCAANQGGDLCALYGKQCTTCPIYAKWTKTKKRAYEVKMPKSYSDTEDTSLQDKILSQKDTQVDYDIAIPKIHEKMEKKLKPSQYKVYKMLYIDEMPEDEVAKIMEWKVNKYNRTNKYKPLENYRKIFVAKAKEIIDEENLG